MRDELRRAILATSGHLGIAPIDLATAMSYETAGTFDPWKRGPTTKWGTHRGLIQWGEPQARQYGVSEETPVADQVAAAGRYLQDRGVKPGHGLLEIYSAINAGGVGDEFYGRSDAHAGGAPGTVRDKVQDQMAGHRRNAQGLLGQMLTPEAADFARNNPQPGGYGPDVEAQTGFFPKPAPPQIPTMQMTGSEVAGSAGIPDYVASYATSEEPVSMGDRLGGFFSALGKAADVSPPRPAAHPGGPSPNQASAVLDFLNSPKISEMLMRKRFSGVF